MSEERHDKIVETAESPTSQQPTSANGDASEAAPGCVAVCKNCNEQIVLTKDVTRVSKSGALVDVWKHVNSEEMRCTSRNGRALLTEAEPLEGSVVVMCYGAKNAETPRIEPEFPPLVTIFGKLRKAISAMLFMMRAFVRKQYEKRQTRALYRAVDDAEVSSEAKCPACGIKAKHDIVWAYEFQKLLHSCSRCRATWAEDPIVRADAWMIKFATPEEEKAAAEPRRAYSVPRTPTVFRAPEKPEKSA